MTGGPFGGRSSEGSPMIKFNEDREFDYGDGPVLHKAGDVLAVHEGGEAMKRGKDGEVLSLRKDKAQRWVTRAVASHVEEVKKPVKAEEPKKTPK